MNLTSIEEKMLLKFCKDKKDSNPSDTYQDDPLCLLKDVFPNFLKDIKGKMVCDFGCGVGNQSIALVNAGAGYVLGVDINQKRIDAALAASSQHKNIEFSAILQAVKKQLIQGFFG